MGGYGSGRYWGPSKSTVEDCLTLDANKLTRDNLLRPCIHNIGDLTWTNTRTGEKVSSCGYELNTLDLSFSWLRLFYTIKSTDEKINFSINLDTTKPYFGGLRWWFICPLRGCNNRVAKLHHPPGGKYYGCRRCYDLTYKSCQESHQFDALYAHIARNAGTTPHVVKNVLSGKFG